MITKEQVADLRPGDVVELFVHGWPQGTKLIGPAYSEKPGDLWVGPERIRYHDGDVFGWSLQRDSALTVVSRAPRPLYVNHERTEPVAGDVVRDGEGRVRHCDATGWAGRPTWWAFGAVEGCKWTHDAYPLQPLTLLVDGETGQVVP